MISSQHFTIHLQASLQPALAQPAALGGWPGNGARLLLPEAEGHRDHVPGEPWCFFCWTVRNFDVRFIEFV